MEIELNKDKEEVVERRSDEDWLGEDSERGFVVMVRNLELFESKLGTEGRNRASRYTDFGLRAVE